MKIYLHLTEKDKLGFTTSNIESQQKKISYEEFLIMIMNTVYNGEPIYIDCNRAITGSEFIAGAFLRIKENEIVVKLQDDTVESVSFGDVVAIYVRSDAFEPVRKITFDMEDK